MLIIKGNQWHKDQAPLEKFFFERIVQRCDSEEVISNKHRTVTGYIQVKELIKISELAYKKEKNIKTLATLIDEARCTLIKQNIKNDDIIVKYFNDLRTFIEQVQLSHLTKDGKPDLNFIGAFLHRMRIFEAQLEQFYYSSLTTEILSIDFLSNKHFARTSEKISSLIDLYIPYLIFQGYSITSLAEVLKKWINMKYRPTPQRLLSFFNFQQKDFYFLINLGDRNKETEDFTTLLQETYPSLEVIKATDLSLSFVDKEGLFPSDTIAKFNFSTIDPHTQIRNSYDQLLKGILIRRERPSLHTFNNFFEGCYWGFDWQKGKHRRIIVNHDPINVNSRISTLRTTLICSSTEYGYSFGEESYISTGNENLLKSIYYYNLSLGSKSLESSLSLLWTSLETLLPYRIATSDIVCVQEFVSKSLSIGAIGRDLFSFIRRIIETNNSNEKKLSKIFPEKAPEFSSKGLKAWFEWLIDGNFETKMVLLKENSELLTFLFVKLGKSFSEDDLEWILNRTKASEESIKFQLQRIYLHRNQIVHSGNFVSEYSNLWLHLEWYVGKLLAYSLIRLELLKEKKSLETIFVELESEHNYLMSYLFSNKKKKIKDATRVLPLLFKEFWQIY